MFSNSKVKINISMSDSKTSERQDKKKICKFLLLSKMWLVSVAF
jgi:hypothetical protein